MDNCRNKLYDKPIQIEVMEIEHYDGPTCNKLRLTPSHDAATVLGVVTSSTVDEYCGRHDRPTVTKFSKFGV